MWFEIFFAKCKKKHSAKKLFAECKKKKHSANSLFAECKKTLDKGIFAECPKNNTRQTTWHSAKSRSPVVPQGHYVIVGNKFGRWRPPTPVRAMW